MSSAFSNKVTQCHKCGKNAMSLERIQVNEELVFHEGCFVCEECDVKLSNTTYSSFEGSFYCMRDYYALLRKLKAPSETSGANIKETVSSVRNQIEIPGLVKNQKPVCSLCNKRVFQVAGMSITIEDKLIHKACFVCSECKEYLTEENYHSHDGSYYCPAHYFRVAQTNGLRKGINRRLSVSSPRSKDFKNESVNNDKNHPGGISDHLPKSLSPQPSENIANNMENIDTNEPVDIEGVNEDLHKSNQSSKEIIEPVKNEDLEVVDTDVKVEDIHSDPHCQSNLVDDTINGKIDGENEFTNSETLVKEGNIDETNNDGESNALSGVKENDSKSDSNPVLEEKSKSSESRETNASKAVETSNDILEENNLSNFSQNKEQVKKDSSKEEKKEVKNETSREETKENGEMKKDEMKKELSVEEKYEMKKSELSTEEKDEITHILKEDNQEIIKESSIQEDQVVKEEIQTKEENQDVKKEPSTKEYQETEEPIKEQSKKKELSTEEETKKEHPLEDKSDLSHETQKEAESSLDITKAKEGSKSKSRLKSKSKKEKSKRKKTEEQSVEQSEDVQRRKGRKKKRKKTGSSKIEKEKNSRRRRSTKESIPEETSEEKAQRRQERRERRKREKREISFRNRESIYSSSKQTKNEKEEGSCSNEGGGDIVTPRDEKKSKSKRGVMQRFSRKKANSISKPETSSSTPVASPTSSTPVKMEKHSTLSSFVSGRWRKSKKDLSRILHPSATTGTIDLNSPKMPDIEDKSNEYNTIPLSASQDSVVDKTISENEDPSTVSIAIVDENTQSDDILVEESSEANSSLDKELLSKAEQIIKPTDIEMPCFLMPIKPIHLCSDLIEHEPSILELDVPDGPGREVSKIGELKPPPPIEIDFDSVIPKPQNEHERIRYEGILRPTVVRIGIVGMQRRLFHILGEMCSSYPHQIEIVASTNLSDKALSITREHFGDDFKQVDTLNDLLSIDDIEWIFVGSYTTRTSEIIQTILQHGKNVFCEKPSATNITQCIDIQERLHKNTFQHFLCGFVWRHVPFYQEVYNIISQGAIGDILTIEANHLLDPGAAGLLMSDWTRLSQFSHSLVMESFIYDIDLLCWLLGSLPSEVVSFSGRNMFVPERCPQKEEIRPYEQWPEIPMNNVGESPFGTDITIDDNQLVIMNFSNGSRVTLHLNVNSAFPQRRLLICGTTGTLEGDLYTGKIRYRFIGEESFEDIQVTPGSAHGGSDHRLVEGFMLCALQGDTEFCSSGTELFPSIATALAITESKENNQVVDMRGYWEKLQNF